MTMFNESEIRQKEKKNETNGSWNKQKRRKKCWWVILFYWNTDDVLWGISNSLAFWRYLQLLWLPFLQSVPQVFKPYMLRLSCSVNVNFSNVDRFVLFAVKTQTQFVMSGSQKMENDSIIIHIFDLPQIMMIILIQTSHYWNLKRQKDKMKWGRESKNIIVPSTTVVSIVILVSCFVSLFCGLFVRSFFFFLFQK